MLNVPGAIVEALFVVGNRVDRENVPPGNTILNRTITPEQTDLWGVARRAAEKLTALGDTTSLQLRDADPLFLRERFSVVLKRTLHELRGPLCTAFEDVPPNRERIVASRSFGRPVLLATEMAEAVAVYTVRAAENTRRHGLAATFC